MSCFKSPSDLEKIFESLGVSREKQVFTYWQGGIRAAHVLFTLKLMGFEKVSNYDGSMGEWANMDGMPLE